MGRLVIASGALVDSATLTGLGTIAGSRPIANLQDSQLGTFTRWTSLTGMGVDIDLGSAKAINLFAAISHNATSAGTWQIKGATSQANLTSSPGYNPGAGSLWPVTGKPDLPGKLTSIKFLAAAQTFRWWRIEFTDAANPDGYFDVGRIYVDGAFQPARNLAYGWQVLPIDPSTEIETIGGQSYVTPRPIKSVLRLRLPALTEDEAMGRALAMQKSLGIQKDVLAIRDPDATTWLQQQMVYGRLQTLPGVTNTRFKIYETAFDVKEMLA